MSLLAKFAICGRCVIAITCECCATFKRAFPINRAVSPPIPASISSKKNIEIESLLERIVLNARRILESSPPDATSFIS